MDSLGAKLPVAFVALWCDNLYLYLYWRPSMASVGPSEMILELSALTGWPAVAVAAAVAAATESREAAPPATS